MTYLFKDYDITSDEEVSEEEDEARNSSMARVSSEPGPSGRRRPRVEIEYETELVPPSKVKSLA